MRSLFLSGLAVVAANFATLVPLARACGVVWAVPVNHFDGVNEQGYVSIWEEVEEVDFGKLNGESLKLPLIINFRSNRASNSPYLGNGWMLALLESHIHQVDENRFILVQPNGLQRWFWRGKPTESTLRGQGGWMAEINGDTVSAWADCGWRLDFVNGRIVSMTTPKNRRLEFAYNGGMVAEIRENGVTKLAIVSDSSGKFRTLVFNGKQIEVEMGEKPRIDQIAGLNTIGSIESSFRKFTGSQQSTSTYDFAVDSKVAPTMIIDSGTVSERVIGWNPQSRRINTDGEWRYEIEPSVGYGNASILRTNEENQSELWHYDASKGEEIIQALNGSRVITTRFVSGAASGKIRKKVQIRNGISEVVMSASYDPNGKLIRMQEGSSELSFEAGKLVSIRRDGGLVWGQSRTSASQTLDEEMR